MQNNNQIQLNKNYVLGGESHAKSIITLKQVDICFLSITLQCVQESRRLAASGK